MAGCPLPPPPSSQAAAPPDPHRIHDLKAKVPPCPPLPSRGHGTPRGRVGPVGSGPLYRLRSHRLAPFASAGFEVAEPVASGHPQLQLVHKEAYEVVGW